MGTTVGAHWRACISIGMLCLLSVGCNTQGGPETYPTTGKVVTKDGQPHTSGLITFTLTTDPETKCSGGIGEDGTFTLNTVVQSESSSKSFKGRAPAGEYHVSIYPYPGTAGGGRAKYTLKKTYTIEPNEANDITVVMEPVVK